MIATTVYLVELVESMIMIIVQFFEITEIYVDLATDIATRMKSVHLDCFVTKMIGGLESFPFN